MKLFSKEISREKVLYGGLIITFAVLYLATAFVSWYHAITFFNIANAVWLSVILSFVAEIGQASALFSILLTHKQKFLTWGVMIILTTLQVIGNVVSSYDWIITHNSAGVEGFQKSILFWMQTTDSEVFKVVIAWISGALLPIIALSMTALVAQNMELRNEDNKTESDRGSKPESEPIPANLIISEVSKVRPTEEEMSILENVLNKKVPIVEPPKIVEESVTPLDKDDIMNEDLPKEGKKTSDGWRVKDGVLHPDHQKFLDEMNARPDRLEVPPPDQLSNEEIENSLLGIEFSPSDKDESAVPYYSDEEISDMSMDEHERTGTYHNNEDPDVLDDEVEQLTEIKDEQPELIVTHKDGEINGVLETSNTEPIGIKESPSDEDKKKLEEERLEKLRAIARENLKKK